MTAQWIREHYGVPAKIGARIKYTSPTNIIHEGNIVGFRRESILIKFDDNKQTVPMHPTWRIEYL